MPILSKDHQFPLVKLQIYNRLNNSDLELVEENSAPTVSLRRDSVTGEISVCHKQSAWPLKNIQDIVEDSSDSCVRVTTTKKIVRFEFQKHDMRQRSELIDLLKGVSDPSNYRDFPLFPASSSTSTPVRTYAKKSRKTQGNRLMAQHFQSKKTATESDSEEFTYRFQKKNRP